MNWIKSGFLVLLLVVSIDGTAQLLDDSTKVVYGAFSTKYFHESDIKFNTKKQYSLDTSLATVHKVDWRRKNNYRYQDLGNFASALYPTFYQFPTTIGATAGYNAYNLYAPEPNEIRYYETRSPFIELNLIFAKQGRSMGDFTFARNIKEKWNVGFNFRKIEADKQIGAQSLRGDRNIRGLYYDFFMSYGSANDRYYALGYVSRFSHSVFETGGIAVGEADTLRSDLFRYRDSDINLRTAKSKDFRLNYHLYHQYKIAEFSQIYHSIRRSKQENSFSDFRIGSNTDFYPTPLIDVDSTQDKSNFIYLENEIGLKGRVGPLFYLGYLKRRDIDHTYRYFKAFEKTSETYFGFNARFDFSETVKLGGDAEFLQNGNFKANAFLETPLVEAGYHAAQYEPSNLQKSFLGNHFEWHNSFDPTVAFEIYGNLKYSNDFISIKPGGSFTTIDNYIYYDTLTVPKQVGSAANITGVNLNVAAKLPLHFHVNADAKYSEVLGDGAFALRIPKIFVVGGVFYDNFIFNNYMQVRVGIDVYYRSAHFANAYDPISQQFHLQDEIELQSYYAADFYFNTKINNLMIFLKYNHINMPNFDGYFVTPNYPGLQRMLDIGFKWRWFD
ncbi:MAG: putative porin [Cyclobacteriaceae bacterium]